MTSNVPRLSLFDFKRIRGCCINFALYKCFYSILSPYLFILCAEILKLLIQNNKKVKGIDINGYEVKISQFADDTTIFLDGSQLSLQTALNVLETLGTISGLVMNTTKTKVI